jgi:type IV fimbrial biogenesis protein FimT
MNQQGLTLVELLVTLAIGAILLGIGVPSYGYFVNHSRMVGLTNEIVGALNLARSEAIKRGVRVSLCTTTDFESADPYCESGTGWENGWIVFVDRGVVGVRDADDQILWKKQGSTPNITVKTANFTDYASYLPSGVSQGASYLATGHFYVCLPDAGRQIIINRVGRIRLENNVCPE